MQKSSINKIERIVLIVLAAALFVVFAFYDLSITQTIYDPSNVFGRTFEFLGEQPLQFFGVVAGALLFRLRDKSTRARSALFGILYVIFAVFFAGYAGGQFFEYAAELGAGKMYWLFFLILSAYLAIGFLIGYRIPVRDRNKTFAYAISVVIFYVAIFFVMTLLKTIWHRPRWRYLVTITDDPASLFKSVWQLNPTWPFEGDYASFPSGHTMNAVGTLVMVPLFVDILEIKKGFILRVVSYVWAIMVAVSRIFVGAHFASDVTMGFLLGFLIYDLMFTVIYPRVEGWLNNRHTSEVTE